MSPSFENVTVLPDIEAVAAAAANQIKEAAQRAVSITGAFHLVLAGGGTIKPLYSLLSMATYSSLPWERTKFYWGDERMVLPDHPESNYKQAWNLLLSKVPAKPENIYRVKGELNPESAADEYRSLLKTQAAPGKLGPGFDLVILGMGNDGHTASIFPGPIELEERQLSVIAVRSKYEDRPSDRVTMTPLIINSAGKIIILVAGERKSKALRAALKGPHDPEKWPIHRIRPDDGTLTWFVDQSAASAL